MDCDLKYNYFYDKIDPKHQSPQLYTFEILLMQTGGALTTINFMQLYDSMTHCSVS
jgi:hypothetical protein